MIKKIKNSKRFARYHSVSGLTPILIVVIIGLIGLVGYFILKPNLSQNYIPPTDNTTVTPTPDPTANWKTYTNNKFSFSLKYPPELTINSYEQVKGKEEIVGFVNEIEDKTFIVNVSGLQKDKDLYTWYKLQYEESLNEDQSSENFSGTTPVGTYIEGGYSKVSIAGYEAYQAELITDESFTSTSLFNKNGQIYQFIFLSKAKSDKKVLNQILSTFRFLD